MTDLRDGDRVRDDLGRLGVVLEVVEATRTIRVRWDDAPGEVGYRDGEDLGFRRWGDACERSDR